MAIKKNDPTADKNESTTDQGAKATASKDDKAVDNATDNVAATNDEKTSDAVTTTDTAKGEAAKDTSEVGTGDVANTEETREKIAVNKNGEKIASAPTVDAPVREVTADEAIHAASIGRPMPGVDLKPGDRPDIRTTRPEDIADVAGVTYDRHARAVGEKTGPLSKRVVGKIKDTASVEQGESSSLTPTANYEKR